MSKFLTGTVLSVSVFPGQFLSESGLIGTLFTGSVLDPDSFEWVSLTESFLTGLVFDRVNYD